MPHFEQHIIAAGVIPVVMSTRHINNVQPAVIMVYKFNHLNKMFSWTFMFGRHEPYQHLSETISKEAMHKSLGLFMSKNQEYGQILDKGVPQGIILESDDVCAHPSYELAINGCALAQMTMIKVKNVNISQLNQNFDAIHSLGDPYNEIHCIDYVTIADLFDFCDRTSGPLQMVNEGLTPRGEVNPMIIGMLRDQNLRRDLLKIDSNSFNNNTLTY